MFSCYNLILKKLKLTRALVVFSAVSLASAAIFIAPETDAVMAQSTINNSRLRTRVNPNKPGADSLRPGPGLPITPTTPSFFKSSQVAPTFAVNLDATAVSPVIPYIPNASPNSPNRNVPGAFTTDPVLAVPIVVNTTSSQRENRP